MEEVVVFTMFVVVKLNVIIPVWTKRWIWLSVGSPEG